MAATDDPLALLGGSSDPAAPLVVLLHGRGADENDLIGLARALPPHLAYAAPRGPVALSGGGYTWFENAGLGRPRPDSLNASVAWLQRWLDGVAPAPRPVVPVGFSAGALFGGALALTSPARYAGFALLMGALPLSAGLITHNKPWVGLPVLAVHAESDEVMPEELMAAAWKWVHTESGAEVTTRITAGGHAITGETADILAAWLTGLFPPEP